MTNSKEVVSAYVDVFNDADLDAWCRLFTGDALIWGAIGWGTLGQARPVWRDLMKCLQVNLRVDGIIAEGETVAVRYAETRKSIQAFRGGGAYWQDVRDNRDGMVRNEGETDSTPVGSQRFCLTESSVGLHPIAGFKVGSASAANGFAAPCATAAALIQSEEAGFSPHRWFHGESPSP